MNDANDKRLITAAAVGLIVGGILGMVGSFAPTTAIRGLAWGLDGVALVVATMLLAVHHIRHGHDLLAAGFLVFALGEALVVSGSAMELEAAAPGFGAGVGLWSAALALVSAPRILPGWVRALGAVASVLFAAVALLVFAGLSLNALSSPLPFFAYPFLVVTLFGWAWVHLRSARNGSGP